MLELIDMSWPTAHAMLLKQHHCHGRKIKRDINQMRAASYKRIVSNFSGKVILPKTPNRFSLKFRPGECEVFSELYESYSRFVQVFEPLCPQIGSAFLNP